MKRSMAVLAAAFISIGISAQAENLIRNGDMSETGGWRGARATNFVTDGDRPVMQLAAHPRRDISVSQPLMFRGAAEVAVRIRVMSRDYAGGGLIIRLNWPGGRKTWSTRRITADGEWHELTHRFTQTRASPSAEFELTLLTGTGTIEISEVVVAPPDARIWEGRVIGR